MHRQCTGRDASATNKLFSSCIRCLIMQHKYKLLVSDIDGTLTDGRGIISVADLQALQDLSRLGVKISACTGRPARGCSSVLTKLPLGGYHIFFDGALVCNADQTEVVYSQTIKQELLGKIYNLAHKHKLTLELFSKDSFFVECESPLVKVHSELMGFNCNITDFSFKCVQENIIMGCLVIPADKEVKLKAIFTEFGNKLKLKISWGMNPARPDIRFININNDDVSKGKAVEALASYLEIELEEVAAIGDGANDISLLETAGLAIAMQNAPPELKAVADCVTGDIEHHGFAQAVRKYLL